MEKIVLEPGANQTQILALYENEQQVGHMVVSIRGNELTAEHTEIEPAYRNGGFGAKLVAGMADYVRTHGMRVAALCPYTYAQFNRHPEKYADIWRKGVRPLNA